MGPLLDAFVHRRRWCGVLDLVRQGQLVRGSCFCLAFFHAFHVRGGLAYRWASNFQLP